MSMSDPIADMLTRIRNASRAGHSSVEMDTSKMKRAIAQVLREEGYIESFEERGEVPKRVLRIRLRYTAGAGKDTAAPGGHRESGPVLTDVQRVSKPGVRVYAKSAAIPRVYGGLGTAIVSTPQGVMSGTRARRLKLGGEVIATVW